MDDVRVARTEETLEPKRLEYRMTKINPEPVLTYKARSHEKSEVQEGVSYVTSLYHEEEIPRFFQGSSISEGAVSFTPSSRDRLLNLLQDGFTQAPPDTSKKALKGLQILSKGVKAMSLAVETDLQHLSRHAEKCKTVVYLENCGPYGEGEDLWLTLGECSLIKRELHSHTDYCLRAELGMRAVDEEGSPSVLMSLPLVGVQWRYTRGHCSIFEGFIPGAHNIAKEFHVPWPDYAPFAKGKTCMVNGEELPVTPYLPPPNEVLFNEVRGRYVRIYLGPSRP